MKKIMTLILVVIFISSCVTTGFGSKTKITDNINVITIAGPKHNNIIEKLNNIVNDFNSTGSTLTSSNSTPFNVKTTIESKNNSDKTNVIILAGHGNKSGEMGLYNDQYFDYNVLIKICEETPQKDIIMIAGCYSDSITKYMNKDTEDYVIITSTNNNSPTSANDQVGLISSVTQIFKNPIIADYNNDHIITAEEFHKKSIEITDKYLKSKEWLDQAEHWSNHPKSNYGIYGNGNLTVIEY